MHPEADKAEDDRGRARLGVLAQVCRGFGALTVICLVLAVTELGGYGVRPDTARGALALVGSVIGIYGLARWGREAWRIRRQIQR